jgi:hypothetical protein
MTPSRPPLVSLPFDVGKLRIPDFEIIWAGEGPQEHIFCIGSEDGRVAFTTAEGKKGGEPFPVVDSSEAINGVAFAAGIMAVSTRSEVIFWNVGGPGVTNFKFAEFEGGAHAVIATSSGRFVAPLGINGLLSVKPQPGGFQSETSVPDRPLNFYKVAPLGKKGQGDTIAVALRRHGVATISFDEHGQSTLIRDSNGLDVVDVCSLGVEGAPFAAAVLGCDGSIHLSRDLWHDRSLLSLRSESPLGTGYRILSARGHLFVLTSESLTILPEEAKRFLGGQTGSNPLGIWDAPLQAVDAAVAFDRWLLIVIPDGSLRVHDVDQLIQAFRARASDPVGDAETTWETSESKWDVPSSLSMTSEPALIS